MYFHLILFVKGFFGFLLTLLGRSANTPKKNRSVFCLFLLLGILQLRSEHARANLGFHAIGTFLYFAVRKGFNKIEPLSPSFVKQNLEIKAMNLN